MKLQYDEQLTNFAFNFNSRRYDKGVCRRGGGVFIKAPFEMAGRSDITMLIATSLTPAAEKSHVQDRMQKLMAKHAAEHFKHSKDATLVDGVATAAFEELAKEMGGVHVETGDTDLCLPLLP